MRTDLLLGRFACVVAALMGLVGGAVAQPTIGKRPQTRPAPAPAASGVASDAEEPTEIPPAWFRFDNGFEGTPGLWFEFDRAVPTVDPLGLPVGIDQPRFGRATTLAGAPSFETVRAVNGTTTILGSGLDHDGQTPLMVVRDYSQRVIDVFHVAGDELLIAEQTGVGRNRTTLDPTTLDIMQGVIPNRRYEPAAGTVCHGLIVLLCIVSSQPVPPLSAWNIGGIGLVVSQDRGLTWEVVFEDAFVQQNRRRVREWAMQNWWPTTPGEVPLEAFFTGADYRFKPATDGGRIFAFKAARAEVGAPWTIEAPSIIYQTPNLIAGQHAHISALFPFGAGLRAIAAIGDTQAINRIVMLTRPDRSLIPSGWTVDESYHGSEGTAGNQFIGAAPTGTHGEILVGADLSYEQISLLDARGDAPIHRHLYGFPWSIGTPSQCFVLRTPTPERAGPYVVGYDPLRSSLIDYPPQVRRLLYSEDGVHWTQMAAPNTGSDWAAAIHGGHVYFDSDAVLRNGLRRVPLPTLHTARPLAIGAGGMQRLAEAPLVTPGTGGSITALSRNAEGLWVDGGIPLEPQPPALGQVFRVTSVLGAASTLIGDVRLTNGPNLGGVLGTGRSHLKVWIRPNTPHKATSPRIELKPSGGAPILVLSTSANSTDTWFPIDMVLEESLPAGQWPVLRLRSSASGTDDQDFYLALGSLTEGEGTLGYAAAPETSGSTPGLPTPDERARIGGLSCQDSWTISLAGMTPGESWDLVTPTANSTRWPLATVWCASGERVTFSAGSRTHTLHAEVVRNGEVAHTFELGGVVWVRGSSLVISMARAGGQNDLQISVAAAGEPVREMVRTDAVAGPATTLSPPIEIRFGDGTGIDGYGTEIRQTPMLWFGGRIDGSALNQAARAELLRTLGALGP